MNIGIRENKGIVIKESKVGQGFNDARGEVPDQKDIPKHNGQNVNNDPRHLREKKKNEKK